MVELPSPPMVGKELGFGRKFPGIQQPSTRRTKKPVGLIQPTLLAQKKGVVQEPFCTCKPNQTFDFRQKENEGKSLHWEDWYLVSQPESHL